MQRLYVFFYGSLALVFLLFGTACSSMNKSAPSALTNVYIQANIEADIEIGEEITGSATITKVLFFTFGPNKYADGVRYTAGGTQSVAAGLLHAFDPTGAAKRAAAYAAITSSGADVIIDPRYEVTVNNYLIFSEVHAKVTGRKGTIKGYKKLPPRTY